MNQVVAAYFAGRKRCLQCKTVFEQAILMPAGCGDAGCMALNPEVLFHMRDTHGLPEDIYREALLDGLQKVSPGC